jgi:ABC-type bacteriocin/lantibiotic exporter with double-glycine peptidase domain
VPTAILVEREPALARSQATPALADMPRTLAGFVRRASGLHQAALAALAVAVFLLGTAPLEVQRRVVDEAVAGAPGHVLLLLGIAYLGIALTEGTVKFLLNMYRAWISERAVRWLRQNVHRLAAALGTDGEAAEIEGVEISVLLSETEPVGGFVGISVSEPLLQGGLLLSILAYMAWLQPWLALLSLAVFLPQLIFVPLLQGAINRRARSRIQVLREISVGVLSAPAEVVSQTGRIDHVFTLNLQIFQLKFGMNFLMNLMHHVGVAGVLGIGGWQVSKGALDIGTVVAFVSGLVKLNDPWGDVVNWFREMTVVDVKYRLIRDAADSLAAYEVRERAPAA